MDESHNLTNQKQLPLSDATNENSHFAFRPTWTRGKSKENCMNYITKNKAKRKWPTSPNKNTILQN